MNLNHFLEGYHLCYFTNKFTLAYFMLSELQDQSILGENTYNQKLPNSKYNYTWNTT